MTAQLSLDDRLWNLDTFKSLESAQPSIYLGLKSCITAFGRVDRPALERLVAARGAADVEPARRPGEQALHTATIVGGMLMQLIAKLEKAVADAGTNAAPDLVTLLASARRNRTVLLEEAPVLVAEALASSPEYARQRAGAVAAVDAAAERLNAMRARSDDEATPYAELAPLVGQLKELWAGLDRALAPLSRGEQDAIRGERAEPMTTAAKALTRNLFLRKMRDRGRGDWPAPEVLPGETAPERFASALAGGDYGQASTLLAPWLEEEWTAARLEEEMSRSVAEIVAGFDLPVGPPAGAWEVGSNPLDLAALKEDESEAIPEDVSEANFRGWWPVQILTEEEDGWLTDIGYLATLFVIAVELDGQERIGYLRFGE